MICCRTQLIGLKEVESPCQGILIFNWIENLTWLNLHFIVKTVELIPVQWGLQIALRDWKDQMQAS